MVNLRNRRKQPHFTALFTALHRKYLIINGACEGNRTRMIIHLRLYRCGKPNRYYEGLLALPLSPELGFRAATSVIRGATQSTLSSWVAACMSLRI